MKLFLWSPCSCKLNISSVMSFVSLPVLSLTWRKGEFSPAPCENGITHSQHSTIIIPLSNFSALDECSISCSLTVSRMPPVILLTWRRPFQSLVGMKSLTHTTLHGTYFLEQRPPVAQVFLLLSLFSERLLPFTSHENKVIPVSCGTGITQHSSPRPLSLWATSSSRANVSSVKPLMSSACLLPFS